MKRHVLALSLHTERGFRCALSEALQAELDSDPARITGPVATNRRGGNLCTHASKLEFIRHVGDAMDRIASTLSALESELDGAVNNGGHGKASGHAVQNTETFQPTKSVYVSGNVSQGSFLSEFTASEIISKISLVIEAVPTCFALAHGEHRAMYVSHPVLRVYSVFLFCLRFPCVLSSQQLAPPAQSTLVSFPHTDQADTP